MSKTPTNSVDVAGVADADGVGEVNALLGRWGELLQRVADVVAGDDYQLDLVARGHYAEPPGLEVEARGLDDAGDRMD